ERHRVEGDVGRGGIEARRRLGADEVDLVAAARQLEADLGGDDAAATERVVAGDAYAQRRHCGRSVGRSCTSGANGRTARDIPVMKARAPTAAANEGKPKTRSCG